MELKGHLGSVEFDGGVVRLRKTARGEQMMPIANISAVQIVPAGFGMKAIRFSVAGGSTAGKSSALGNHSKVAKDPFALTFPITKAKAFGDFAAAVLSAMAAN